MVSGKLTAVPDIAPQGLTPDEVAQRVASGKVNALPSRSGRSVGEIVRANVFTRINAILAVLLVIVLATGSWINGAFGLLIVANSAIGIIQELRAKRTLDELAVVGEAQPLVRRADGVRRLPRDEVVLDDLIELTPGDQVVVDGEVVEADHLEIDESLLTGESDPEPKGSGDPVMSGSFAVSGAGVYRATRVGADAYAAQIAAEASRFTLVHSELQSGINRILRFITWLLVPVGLATIWVQLSQPGATWQQAVLRMAGAIVPMVPEGLVLITSMAFALGVIRLGRRQCLVQELPAIEGLARVDVVCADKTGTLTENGMRFGEVRTIAGHDEAGAREALANLAVADPHPNASLTAIGEGVGEPGSTWTASARVPFTSAQKWSGVSFGENGSWVLGAPEVLAHGEVADRAEAVASSGLRVLLLGRRRAGRGRRRRARRARHPRAAGPARRPRDAGVLRLSGRHRQGDLGRQRPLGGGRHLEARGGRGRARRRARPRDGGAAGRRGGVPRRVRAGHAPAEARDGRRAAEAGPHGGHDR